MRSNFRPSGSSGQRPVFTTKCSDKVMRRSHPATGKLEKFAYNRSGQTQWVNDSTHQLPSTVLLRNGYPAIPETSGIAHQTPQETISRLRIMASAQPELLPSQEVPLKSGKLNIHSYEYNHLNNQILYGAYTPYEAKEIIGEKYNDFLPSQMEIANEHYDFYLEEMQIGEPVAGIEAAVTQNNHIKLLDGHHRIAAAMQTQRTLDLALHMDPESEDDALENWRQVNLVEM